MKISRLKVCGGKRTNISRFCLSLHSAFSISDWSSDYANFYQGLWDCQADEADELPFQRGDLIYIVSKVSFAHQQTQITHKPLFCGRPLF